MGPYQQAYKTSIESPEEFWRDAASLVAWDVAPSRILDASKAPLYRW